MIVRLRSVSSFGLALMSAFLLLAPTAAARSPLAAEFDCAASHQFAGFGLQVWALPGRVEPLLGLVRDLPVKFARWKLLPNVDKSDIPDTQSVEELADWLERTATEEDRLGFTVIAHLQSMGIDPLMVSWRVPIKWQQPRTGPEGQTFEYISPARIVDYARLLAAQLVVLKRHHVEPYAIDLLNEPVNKIFPPQYAQLVSEFLSWRGRLGLSAVRLAGPGVARTWVNDRFIESVVRAGGKFEIASTNAWDSRTTRQLASLSTFRSFIPPAWRSPIFVTEYGVNPEVWFNSPDAAETMPYGVVPAAQTLALLDSGANAVSYWQAQDPPRARRAMGLLDKEDRPRPALDALRTILRPLAAGDQVAFSGNHPEARPTAVFVRPGQLVVEMANMGAEAPDYTMSFRNCSTAPIIATSSESWPAAHPVSVQPISAAAWHVTLPGDSVAAITASR